MKYEVFLSHRAEEDLLFFKKSGNKVALSKIASFIDELRENPYFGTGKPEKLKYQEDNIWSRRIDSKNRLVYRIEENIVVVEIISAKGHYQDK